jgi:uncharacterized protein
MARATGAGHFLRRSQAGLILDIGCHRQQSQGPGQPTEVGLHSQSRAPSPSGHHVAVTGASGLLGSAIVVRLGSLGYRVSRLVRRTPGTGEIAWDPSRGRLDPAVLEGVDAVVHLSGEPLDGRWTTSRKERIRGSRVDSTRLLSETLAGLERKPGVLISASAIGIYGERGDEVLTETSAPGRFAGDFLASVAQQWEEAAEPARRAGIRVVHPRFGIVLSARGGALQKLLPAFRWGAGARMGNGRQWMSWVSIADAVGAVEHCLAWSSLNGPVNITAPEPVTNAEFTQVLGQILARPTLLRIPAGALSLALGEMARATVLASTRVEPARLLGSGYEFRHPSLESALRSVLAYGRD